MKTKILILLAIFTTCLVSCEKKMVWLNPDDPEADLSKISAMCEEKYAECGYIEQEFDGKMRKIFCGECTQEGYECKTYNRCEDIDECADTTLNNCQGNFECHNLDIKFDGKPFECVCKKNYSGDDCTPETRTKECVDLPENAEWNSVSEITQTWNGEDWEPSNQGTFNEEVSETECRFKCRENYDWNGSTCIAETREADCDAKPENSVWNDGDKNGTFTQTWDGTDWNPATHEAVFNKTPGECIFKCDDTHYWYNSQCTSPCDYSPCADVTNSTKVCTATSWQNYSCGCISGYFWNGSECQKQITLGNICTGQNKCYNNSSSIECPTSPSEDFFGQDAQYAKAGYCYPQSFTVKTVSGQNIVVDNNTGLEWQQVISEDIFNWDDAVSHCESLEYAGYTDWRLPTPQELLTIVDNGQFSPAIDSTYFPDTAKNNFWSSSTRSDNTDNTWHVGFGSGSVDNSYNKSKSFYVRCVRGESLPNSTFNSSTVNGDIIVTDSKTGLIWQQTYVKEKTWQEALKYCEDLSYAGYTDWRLPNKNELASLVNYAKNDPASDFPGMPNLTPYFFWSSSTCVDNTNNAWYVHFQLGYVDGFWEKDDDDLVRCVRNAE